MEEANECIYVAGMLGAITRLQDMGIRVPVELFNEIRERAADGLARSTITIAAKAPARPSST